MTLLTQVEPDASKFRVFGCAVFAKVPDKLRRKLGEKAFRSVMVGYPPGAPCYRVYNPVTRRITTSVHVMFQKTVPDSLPSPDINPLISDETETVSGDAMFPFSHAVSLDLVDNDDGPPLHDDTRQTRVRSHPIRFGEYVAHLSAHPPVYVIACCGPKQGVAREDIVEQPNLAFTVAAPPHQPVGIVVALLYARDCVEPASYRAALSIDHYTEWHVAMQHEYDSLLSSGTWELVDLPAGRAVVNNMWIYKIKSDLDGDVSRYKLSRFVAKGCSKRA
jgi:hypothetical protein